MVKYELVTHDRKDGWRVKGGADTLVDARELAVNVLLVRNKLNDYAYIRVDGKDKYIIQIGPGGYKPGEALARGYHPTIATIEGTQFVHKKGVNLDGTIMRRY